MPAITGIEVLEGLHAHENGPPMILITVFGDEETHAPSPAVGSSGDP
jgi:FixJ family two-component response regulator